MAAASPTPMPVYGMGANRISRLASRSYVRRDSPPLNITVHAASHASQRLADDSDDDIQPPPQLSVLGRSVLEQDDPRASMGSSPNSRSQAGNRTRSVRHQPSGSNTPSRDTTTPAAPSQRVRRIGLQGLPVRRAKRTPQSEEDQGSAERNPHSQPEEHEDSQPPVPQHRYEQPPEQDQENAPASIVRRPDSALKSTMVVSKPQSVLVHPDSIMKAEGEKKSHVYRDRHDKAIPLAQMSANTPHRPAPAPPPKMSIIEAATKAAGASTTRKRTRRPANFTLNGKSYTQMEKCGRGGSGEVFRVQAENGKTFALKKVRLAGADEHTIAGYKGEIDLLKKLYDVPRVVHLYDYTLDEEKQMLYVLMELGDGDLEKVLNSKMNSSTTESSSTDSIHITKPDFPFIRYWWKEMLSCVEMVHEKEIVHTDLKPANFLVVKGGLKLIDFGIAGSIDVENTVNMYRDNAAGTVNYMSPESLQGGTVVNPSGGNVGKYMRIGKSSDVWSLGCILYKMVYGQTPFDHITPAIPAKVMAIINPQVVIDIPSTTSSGYEVPTELRKTIKKCLQRDPTKRPTVSELLSDRDEFLHPEQSKDLKISEQLLDQIIKRVAERFKDKSKSPPTEEEIAQYAGNFYSRIRAWDT